ncbi:MAG: hypothetical protein ACYDBB_25495 [Armatimonadota bacterium]
MSEDAYRRALRSGNWSAFAITDHAFSLALPDDEPWPFQWFENPERLWAQRTFREDKTAQYLEFLGRVTDSEQIFGGLEVEVACDGSLSMDSALWPYLDVVIGSIHHLPGDQSEWVDRYFEQLNMLLMYPIDILGHPFRNLSRMGPIPDEVIDETLYLVKDIGVAIEINAHMPFERDADVLIRAAEQGIRVAFGLDAHHRHELSLYTYFEEVVAKSGLPIEQVRLFKPVRKAPKPHALVW